jgi:hypothetical protein
MLKLNSFYQTGQQLATALQNRNEPALRMRARKNNDQALNPH